MFKEISWSSYVGLLIVLLSLYYLFIAIRYYRKDIRQSLNKKKDAPPKAARQTTFDESEQPERKVTDAALFPEVYYLLEDLKPVFENARIKKLIKEELLMSLEIKLSDYQHLAGTAFQVAVNNHIIQQAANICGMELSDEHLKQIW